MNNLGTIYCPFLHVNILLIPTPQFFFFFFYHLSYFSMQYMFSYFLIYTVIHSQESMHSHMWLFVIPCKVAHQDPLSMGFSHKNTGVDCYFFLQGIFPTQRSNLCLNLHWQADSLPLSHLGCPPWVNIQFWMRPPPWA